MPELPELLKFEEVNGENRWTYPLKSTFNYQPVNKITITDYIWKKKRGRETITKELIWSLFQEKIHKKPLRPVKYYGNRKPYIWDEIYDGKWYRAYFWHDNNSTSHLWIRNFHRIDPPKKAKIDKI